MGALCSITALIILITYAGYKLSIMEGKKSVDIVQAVIENHFDDEYVFDSEKGFNFAVAVFNPFDPSTHKLPDPQFGRIKVSKLTWGPDENGVFSISNIELDTHPCSPEELGLSGSDHSIWPINESQKTGLETFRHLMYCVDKSQLAVQGNSSSQ